jgi:phosphotriesterase-related protein
MVVDLKIMVLQLNSPSSKQVMFVHTVLGKIPLAACGITDGHNHVWIDKVLGSDPSSPVLNNFEKICEELKHYYALGGRSILDCQPGGCGRNANKLVELSKVSGVNIISCTGFHRSKYYPEDYWLFNAQAEKIAEFMIHELSQSLEECEKESSAVTAGFIKIALEDTWDNTPQKALLGAAMAAQETCAMIEIHTEKGALAERLIPYFDRKGVSAEQLVICHMDKRPDVGLHAELAKSGVLLEYDTFFREKYQPETNLWPLIEKMALKGLEDKLVLATDMAERHTYKALGGVTGLESFPGVIQERLRFIGIPENSIQMMMGGNITKRLACLST